MNFNLRIISSPLSLFSGNFVGNDYGHKTSNTSKLFRENLQATPFLSCKIDI